MCVGGKALGVSDQDYPTVCAAVYSVMEAEPLVYLTKIIQGLIAYGILPVGSLALGVSDQDYPRVCADVYIVLEAEPLVYLTKIIQGCLLRCTLC